MPRTLLIALLAALPSLALPAWTPPDKPEPTAILRAAQADTRAKRYEDALAKHVWFHENALKHEPAQYGVRLSFALSSWKELADVYPPALEKLKATRDAAEATVRGEGKKAREAFHDFESINSKLEEEEKTVQLFSWLDENRPETAKDAFDVARPALVKAKKYDLCGKYMNAEATYAGLVRSYKHMKDMATKPDMGDRMKDFAERSFSNGTRTLVAVLVQTNRKEEAEKIAAKASAEWDNPEFKKEMDQALTGKVPEPWP